MGDGGGQSSPEQEDRFICPLAEDHTGVFHRAAPPAPQLALHGLTIEFGKNGGNATSTITSARAPESHG